MSLLSRYLKSYRQECHILEDAATIKGVRMFSELQTEYSTEYVYVGAAAGYFEDPRYQGAMLLASGQNQILCFGQDNEQLLNDVLAAFEFYGRIEQRLLYLASEHAPLKDMLQVLDAVIDDPVFVFDIRGRLAEERNGEYLNDPALLSMVQDSRFLNQTVLEDVFLNREGGISHDLTDQPQILHRAEAPDIECVAMYLSQKEEHAGFVMFFPVSRLGIEAAFVLEPLLASVFAQAAEFTAKDSLSQSSHSILLRLLQQESLDEMVLQGFRENLAVEGEAILLVFYSTAIQNYTFRHMLIRQIQKRKIPGISCEFDNFVVALTDDRHADTILENLRSELGGRRFIVGVSMPIREIEEIYTAYQQALFALRTGGKPGVWYCKDVALPYMLSALSEKEMTMKLLHPALPMLRQYDEQNHTCLYETLHLYIHTGMSQTQTAEALYVHLNTLKYRIRRIRELGHIDFEDRNEIFYLELSYALQEAADKQRGETTE